MVKNLISIIIPTYNRAHLIGETLDTVLAQTYINWECIIVDDGSKDDTDQVVADYLKRDTRFKYFKRTDKYLAGGNGARNYGLDLAQGDYIVFFDSDDLMTENHLQVKLDLINSGVYDFGITRTKYFNYTNEQIDKYYNFSTKDISKENYVLQIINWLTLDVIIKSTLAKQVQFNEIIQSGQEYNFYSKLVCISDKGVFLDEVVSLRRHHENSKRTTIAAGRRKSESVAITSWFTFLETKYAIDRNIQKQLVNRVFRTVIAHKKKPTVIKASVFWHYLFKFYGVQALVKLLYYHVNKYTKRFYFLRKRALKV